MSTVIRPAQHEESTSLRVLMREPPWSWLTYERSITSER